MKVQIERVSACRLRSGHLNMRYVNCVDNCFNVRMCVVINIDFTLHAVTSVVFWFCAKMHRITVYIV